jgi:hypothetical protein
MRTYIGCKELEVRLKQGGDGGGIPAVNQRHDDILIDEAAIASCRG